MKFRFTLTHLLIGSLAIIAFVFFNMQKPQSTTAQLDNHPGWFKQFVKLKGDENGQIPHGLTMKWYKADQANQLLHKKAVNDLENIKEIGPFNVGGSIPNL